MIKLAKRVTIKDIAKQVGFSVTTVAKAINDKAKISEDARLLILNTAKQMGYRPNKSARAMASRQLTIGIIYPNNPPEFISYIEAGFHRGAEELADFRVEAHLFTYDNPSSTEQIRESLDKIITSNIDGVVFFAGRNPRLYEKQMNILNEKSIPILFLVTEVEADGSIGVIRLDSEIAGAMAAQFLKLTVPDSRPIAILVGNRDLKVHSRCIDGFKLMANKLGLKICGVFETNDDKQIAFHLTNKLFEEWPDLGGLYISSYNSVGVCEWLEENDKQGDVKVIGHDLYPALVEKIKTGSLTASIFQNQFEFGRLSLHYIYDYLTGVRTKEECSKLMIPQLVMQSNLDCYQKMF